MKTWRQLEAMAKRQGIKIALDGNTAVLLMGHNEIGRAEWWTDDRKTRDRILRATVEAALREGR